MFKIPPVTQAFMLACVAAFFGLQLLPPSFGLMLQLWPLSSGQFMPWQLITYAFLHGTTPHLFFNMLGLWMFGAELERLWGPKRYISMLAASALSAAVVQLLFTALIHSYSRTLGASGALYGLLLAYALMFPRRQFDLIGFLPMALLMLPSTFLNMLGMLVFITMMFNRDAVPIPPVLISAKVMVLIYGAIELALGVFFGNSGIAHFAHLGGMLGAWLMISYWRSGGRRRR
jgi:membrane associated rhomboid family serine protease